MKLTHIAQATGLALFALAGAAQAQVSDGVVKIGVLTDLSGLYSDVAGPGTVVATKMAIDDFIAAEKPTFKIEMVSADHQNKGDIAANKAREWFEKDKVDVASELVTTSVALAVQKIAKEKNRIALISGAASTAVTNEGCNDVTVHWTYDTYAVANGTAKAVTQGGGKKWFFLTADYAFGHALEKDASAVVKANGGEVVGTVRHPFPGTDFSSFLLKAQSSGAQVIGLANAGGDTINSIKQAAEFGIVKGGQKLAGLLVFLPDIHGLGLNTAQGLNITEAFYWDLNDGTRAWSKRFAALHGGKYPSSDHAGVYAGVLHYLKAVDAAKTDDGAKVVAKMKELPTDDTLFGKGTVRADGRKIHPVYLFEVKKPSESKAPYDYYKVVQTIPAEQAFRPLNEGNCPLVAKK